MCGVGGCFSIDKTQSERVVAASVLPPLQSPVLGSFTELVIVGCSALLINALSAISLHC